MIHAGEDVLPSPGARPSSLAIGPPVDCAARSHAMCKKKKCMLQHSYQFIEGGGVCVCGGVWGCLSILCACVMVTVRDALMLWVKYRQELFSFPHTPFKRGQPGLEANCCPTCPIFKCIFYYIIEDKNHFRII